ncbi:ABC transporter substrate-binding protein [Melghirimyces profundicolus]|uniref:ABC transporter substrate-binding protein n=1 Tax=Melghirimyces profundicolus TaxID=1242148 RepID=UPI003CCC0542
MKIRKLQLLVLTVLLAFSLTGCLSQSMDSTSAGGGKKNEEEAKTETPEVAEGEKVVNIGYSGPLSGPAALYGQNVLNGIEMAAKEINNSGGFKVGGQTYKINLVALDDKYLPNETGTNAKRLVQEKDTSIVFIPHSGGVLASQVFNEKDEFIIGAYTSEPRIEKQNNALTVGIPPKYSNYPEMFSEYAMKKFGKRLAVLPTATQYGKDWTETLVPVWKKMGGEVVYKTEIDFNKETDFYSTVTNALDKKPDVLFVGGPSEPTALVMKQAKQLGFKGGFMVMDQAKMEEMAKVLGGYDKLNGMIGVKPVRENNEPGTANFVKTYESKYKKLATSESAFNYQSLYVFVEAMKAAGTVDEPKKIMAGMDEGIKNLPKEKSIYPLEGITQKGGFIWPPHVAAVEDGKVVIIEGDKK